MASITDSIIKKAIRDAKSGGADVWKFDASRARGVGRLWFRARATGHGLFYFRYSNSEGTQDRLPLGVYDKAGKAGLTLKRAREKAGEFSRLYRAGHRDLRAYVEHQQAEDDARIETAARERAKSERQATSGTTRALLNGYVAHLERQGKQAAQDARNNFRRNVYEEFPHLAAMRAANITDEDAAAILAKLVDRGAGRTAAKLRAYSRAAWAAALEAKRDPTIHPDLHGFNLTANPWALVSAKSLARFNRARERVLNESELGAFLKELGDRPGLYADAIMLSLLLGGQRSAQLVRARPADLDLDGRTITLYDPKGARQNPRAHVLPLTDRALAIVEPLLEQNAERAYLITSNGRVPVRTETLSALVTDISKTMVKAKKARESFQLRDLRRTCETMLAGMRISKDVRAQIASHGLGGVQDRHYDRHSYMDEKQTALQAWDERLHSTDIQERAFVVPIYRLWP